MAAYKEKGKETFFLLREVNKRSAEEIIAICKEVPDAPEAQNVTKYAKKVIRARKIIEKSWESGIIADVLIGAIGGSKTGARKTPNMTVEEVMNSDRRLTDPSVRIEKFGAEEAKVILDRFVKAGLAEAFGDGSYAAKPRLDDMRRANWVPLVLLARQ